MNNSYSDNNTRDTCYICFDNEGKSKAMKFYDTGCGCSDSHKIHKKCLSELLLSRGTNECPVCRRDIIELCENSGQRIIYEKLNDSLVSKYTVNSSGYKNGVLYEIYTPTNINVTMMEFRNGSLHGEFNKWWPSGAIRLQGSYAHGKRHGAFYEFEEDPFMGYTEVMYCHDSLIEYSKFNRFYEKVDYEYYGDASMNALASELASEYEYSYRKTD